MRRYVDIGEVTRWVACVVENGVGGRVFGLWQSPSSWYVEPKRLRFWETFHPRKIAQSQEGDRDYDVFCARSSSALFSRQFF